MGVKPNASPYAGRRTPYTALGIRRKACIRCGQPARYQWNACANGNRWLPICAACDVAVNEIVLRFLRVPHADALLAVYRTLVFGDAGSCSP